MMQPDRHGYVELHARSAFSFLRGASLPETLAEATAAAGLPALAVCDRMGLYGAPRLRGAAQAQGIRPIHGAELVLEDDTVLPVLVENRTGYRNLCRLLSTAHLRAPKGTGRVRWDELPEHADGLVALTGDEEGPLHRALATDPATAPAVLDRLVAAFGPDDVQVEIQRHHRRGEERIHGALVELAARHRLPLLATQGPLAATAAGREVLDVFTCLRHHVTLDAAGTRLAVNGDRHVIPAAAMAARFPDLPDAVAQSGRLAARLAFRLEDLGYAFPTHPVGPGESMDGVLAEWTRHGARQRYPSGVPDKVRRLLDKELALIGRLGFAGYFLLVADLVRYCRDQGILAQGRGSAANSAVCFCLGITAVDPVRFNVLFERFLSEGRKGWPDIDIDLPSGPRREQVIQEVYRRYGPHGAAMTGTVVTFRGRSTARELGRVLGLPADVLDRFGSLFGHGDFPHDIDLHDQMEQAGLPREHPRAAAFARVHRQLSRLPRHLGQHSGGMIICQGRLHEIVPLENASMDGRVVAQWDKDDCEDLGIIKVDLLGLGMMSVLQDSVALAGRRGRPVDLADLPEPDPATYAMLQRADTVGVFQVESRAQMATLPRMRPACFYDLVIQVAIIRPGPIQGDLAHPYLRRRNGEEAVAYDDDRLRPVLERTLGIPLFQEQMLQIAMVMADFSGDDAEELRRALSFHRSDERMHRAVRRLREALLAKGTRPEVAERIVRSVGSFALYGFPESHAISFALLAYASAWLKVHRTAEFFAALLNNQPMGFYSPATVVRDARRHGLRIRPVCVRSSDWDTRVDDDTTLRLGLRQVHGVSRPALEAVPRERARRPFASLEDFRSRTGFDRDELRILARTGALADFTDHRRAALWEVSRPVRDAELPGTDREADGDRAVPAPMDPVERLQADYAGLRLTTGPHPMSLVRDRLPDLWRAADLSQVRHGQRIRVGGQVICRQRPGTAKGICFVSLEDETGITNVIVSPALFESERLRITSEPFLTVDGTAQVRQGTIHIRATRIGRLPFTELQTAPSHDFG